MIPIDLPPPPPRPPCVAPAHYRAGGRPQSIDSVVSDTYPIRVHWAEAGYDVAAADYLSWLELAWAVQVDELGFRAPVLPDAFDGPELDVYIAPVGDWEAWAEPDNWDDAVTGDGHMGTAAYIVVDQGITPDWRGSYIVHEFNHVLQFATDFTEPTLTIWEATAVASQKWTMGDEGEWAYDVTYFQEAPWAPALTGDSYWLWYEEEIGWLYEYGAALWVIHLDEVVGVGDGTMGPALWEAAAQEGRVPEPDVIEAFAAVGGGDLGTAMNTLALSRWLTGDRWDARGIPDAVDWTAAEAVPVEAALTLDDLPLEMSFARGPMITGQGFVTLDVGSSAGTLTATVTSARGLGSAVLVAGPDQMDSTSGEAPSSELVVDGVGEVMVAVSNLGPAGWDGESNAYVEGDQRLALSWIPAGDDPDDETPRSGACGCAPVRPNPVPWLLGVAVLPLVGFRRERGRPQRLG